MTSHGSYAFEHVARARRIMLHECRAYVNTEISRLQRRLQRLPSQINESIRMLRVILELLEEEWVNEVEPARSRRHLPDLYDHPEWPQSRERNSREPQYRENFRYRNWQQ